MSAVERWLPVVGYEGFYEVSDLGHVRSLARSASTGRARAGRVMKLTPTPRGYLRLPLTVNNISKTVQVHRLVLEAFIGPPEVGMQTRHLDGDPSNNRLTNLRWGSVSENNRDRVTHGTHNQTAKTHCPAGHPYSGENLYVNPTTGNRKCRQCTRDYRSGDPERHRQYSRDYYHTDVEASRERIRVYRAKKKAV